MFAWFSARNSREQRAIIEFNARKFLVGEDGKIQLESVKVPLEMKSDSTAQAST